MIGKTNAISGVSAPVPKIRTVSGSVISVSDALAMPAVSLVADINAVQSGSGDPSPDNVRPITGWTEANVTRCGKNMANTASIKRGDGSARAGNEIISLPAGTYTMSANNVGDCSMTIQFWSSSDNMGTKSFNVGQNSNTITVTDDIVRLYCYISTANYNDGKYGELTTIQIETGSSPTAYEPYNGNTYTIQLGQTVYGGSLDVTTGVLTVDRATVDLGSLHWVAQAAGHFMYSSGISSYVKIPSSNDTVANILCSTAESVSANAVDTTSGALIGIVTNGNIRFRYDGFSNISAQFESDVSGMQLVYELATPQTVQLTSTQVQMLLGNNTLWADSGDSELQYWARR